MSFALRVSGIDASLVQPTQDRLPALDPTAFAGPDVRAPFERLARLTLLAAGCFALAAGALGWMASGSGWVATGGGCGIGALALGMLRLVHATSGPRIDVRDPVDATARWRPAHAALGVMAVLGAVMTPYLTVLAVSELPDAQRAWRAEVASGAERQIAAGADRLARQRSELEEREALSGSLTEQARASQEAELAVERRALEARQRDWETVVAPSIHAQAAEAGALAARASAVTERHPFLLFCGAVAVWLGSVSPLLWRYRVVPALRRHHLRRLVRDRALVWGEYQSFRRVFLARFARFGVVDPRLGEHHRDPPFNCVPLVYGREDLRVVKLGD